MSVNKHVFVVSFFMCVHSFFSTSHADVITDGVLEECQSNKQFKEVRKLVNEVSKVTKTFFTKVATMNVVYDSTGDFSVLQDENGNFLALRMEYNNGKMSKTVSIDEFLKGNSLEYTVESGPSPLRLKSKTGFSSTTGGDFVLEIATKLKPLEIKSYNIKLEKANGAWLVSKDGKKVKNVKITPKVSMLKWTGTFEKVDFE